ncbi:L,D-transpeptidase family protein [Halomonas sp. MCCC 1A11081]|uniref:L,D-transpeptidase family protein n=2 Tax=Billgrantia ethanolica TaxID=2733486 RepID=A0ABS9A1Z1_9GAMM|nr:L,D-transpeptidase family protein [Halomonas ethanolica]
MLLVAMTGVSAEERTRQSSVDDTNGRPGLTRALADESSLLQAFYGQRDHRPAWQDEETVAGLVSTLRALEEDGLTPEDYRPDDIEAEYRSVRDEDAVSERQIRYELFASRMLFTALEHLQRGKVDPKALSADWEVPVEAPDLDLAAISDAIDQQRFERILEEARPPYTPYQRLREGLARYRDIERQGGWERLPERDGALRVGDVDDDVVRLRERLAVASMLESGTTGDGGEGNRVTDNGAASGQAREAADPRRFDSDLEAAVRRFQRRHLLEPDGIVGRQTRAALNVPVERRIDQIRLNMERARWLLHGLPEAFVLVDIAGYELSYYRPDGEIWRSRIVVGQPYRRTPSLRSEITHMTVNPTWTIPPTILRQDVLPAVRRDLGYLWRERIQVLSPSGQPLDPWRVDWDNPGNIVLRQAPGPQNALGLLAIRFPNDHMVYLHDTPAQGIFSRYQRAFSSGCIRVENIRELARLLFDDTDSDQDIDARIDSGETRNVSLANRMPVILHYWTVNPDDDGALSFRPDIYERDDELLRALDRPLAL